MEAHARQFPVIHTSDVVVRGAGSRPWYIAAHQMGLPTWAPIDLVDGTRVGKWIVYESGDDARRLLDPLSTAAIVLRRDLGEPHDLELLVRLDLERATAGTRILACGPEDFVAGVAAAARGCGAIDDELLLVPTDLPASRDSAVVDEGVRRRRVFCRTCAELFAADAGLGDLVVCPGCATTLEVHHQYSRQLAAVIGIAHVVDAADR